MDSWNKLTRVLTHEIMNSVTPITSLSETLLQLTKNEKEINRDELQGGLQTIRATGQSLLTFVESLPAVHTHSVTNTRIVLCKGFHQAYD